MLLLMERAIVPLLPEGGSSNSPSVGSHPPHRSPTRPFEESGKRGRSSADVDSGASHLKGQLSPSTCQRPAGSFRHSGVVGLPPTLGHTRRSRWRGREV